jgi:hypothetical protein
MIGVGPVVRSGEILDLPESECHESHEAEPEAFVDGVEADSVDEDFFEEPADSVKPVDGFVFEQGDNQCEGSINEDDCEVVTGTDKESGLSDGFLELGGSGLSLVGFGNEGGEEVGEELEVEFAEFEEEVRVVVGQVLDQEVVEVNGLEHLSHQQQRISPLEYQDSERDQCHQTDDTAKSRHRLGRLLDILADEIHNWHRGLACCLFQHCSCRINHHVWFQEVYGE